MARCYKLQTRCRTRGTMLGLFKQKITLQYFGQSLMYLAKDTLGNEALSSLGRQFPDFDASNGWTPFLESRGVSLDELRLYIRLYQHCSIQAACTYLEPSMPRPITESAVGGFAKQPEGYRFDGVYQTLTSAYGGQRIFHHLIEALTNGEVSIRGLPNPDAGVINARFLIDTFIKLRMPNAPAYMDNFQSYSVSVAVGVTTAQRAIDHILAKATLTR